MAKITNLTRKDVQNLRDEMDAALAKVLAKHGVTADLGRMTFTNEEVRCKLTVSVNSTGPVGAVASTDSAEERKFKQYAYKFGLTGDEFGKTFKSRGTAFTIIKINPRAKRDGYPVIAQNARGTKYKFGAEKAREAV